YKSWNNAEGGPAISPLDRLRPLVNLGAETTGVRHDPDSTEIEPIRVPASLNRHVRMSLLVRVPLASTKQKPELVVVEIEHNASKFGGELGRSSSVQYRNRWCVFGPRLLRSRDTCSSSSSSTPFSPLPRMCRETRLP